MLESFKHYFQQTNQIQSYLGTDKASQDAAEVILFIASRTTYGKKTFLRTISEWLYIPEETVKRAIRLLKNKGLIKTTKKAYVINKESINNLNLSTDEKFAFYASLNSLDDWYGPDNREVRKQWLSFIHGISNVIGLGIETKKSTRRLLAKCICLNECFGCSYPTACIIKRDMKRLTMENINKIIEKDTYVDDLEEIINKRVFFYNRLIISNKARMLYLKKGPRGKVTSSGDWIEAREIAKEASKHTFANDKERNDFIYKMAVIDPMVKEYGSFNIDLLKVKADEDIIHYINLGD